MATCLVLSCAFNKNSWTYVGTHMLVLRVTFRALMSAFGCLQWRGPGRFTELADKVCIWPLNGLLQGHLGHYDQLGRLESHLWYAERIVMPVWEGNKPNVAADKNLFSSPVLLVQDDNIDTVDKNQNKIFQWFVFTNKARFFYCYQS